MRRARRRAASVANGRRSSRRGGEAGEAAVGARVRGTARAMERVEAGAEQAPDLTVLLQQLQEVHDALGGGGAHVVLDQVRLALGGRAWDPEYIGKERPQHHE